MNILLLEDDKQLNRAITKFLTLKGLNLSSFYDGEDVLKQIGGYDLYLLDINTPNISGIDILKYINNSSKSAKVVNFTTFFHPFHFLPSTFPDQKQACKILA